MRKIASLCAALLVSLPAYAGTYVVSCTAPCVAFDGTTQPTATALNRIIADPSFNPGAGLALVADTGQAIYAGTPGTYVAPVVPLVSVGHDGTTGHLIGTLASGAIIDGAMPNTRANFKYWKAATGSGVISAPAGTAVISLTGSGLLTAQTVQLPPSPQDSDLVRVTTTGTLTITLLTIQDATGVSVSSGLGLSALSSMLFQYQVNAWVRIG